MTTERDAIDCLKEADKLAKYTGWFGGNKQEDAADMYNKAANAFKMAKKCTVYYVMSGKESGDAFIQQAQCLLKCNEKDEAATAFMNASKSYNKASPQGFIH
jgi:alpha-soluble NSF attachment protein